MGFCSGVRRAVNMVEEKSREKKLATCGPLIHNPRFVSELERRGVRQISSVDDLDNETPVIRSHGAEKSTYEKLEQLGIEYLDATCPIVIKSQKIVADLSHRGVFTVIIGNPDHSEIKSLKSFAAAGNFLITTDIEELKKVKNKRVGILSQTTLRSDEFEKFCLETKKNAQEVQVFNTVCNATLYRQNAAADMAKKVSLVLVVGGKNSSNTGKLASLCSEIQKRTYHIESCDDIERTWLRSDDIVGITAGASTPESQVEEIIEYLKTIDREIKKND